VFYTLDVQDVLTENFVPGMIKDKVVIFGFLGGALGDPSWSDKFYTPLNLKMAGKANPDMFGVVVHANIVSMIMNEDYVNRMYGWAEILMAILLCLLNVALFSLIHDKLPDWYDGITKLLQVIELLLLTFLMVMIFDLYAFKLEITIALAAIALVGDAYEIYIGVIKNLVNRLKNRGLFTKKQREVLTP
jgi:CHASE2 domain-containing sensor protein